MALSYVEYNGDGSTQDFPLPFDFVDFAHVQAKIVSGPGAGTLVPRALMPGSIIRLIPAPALGAVVRIYRSTSPSLRLVDFTDGAPVTETDLDLDSKQAFFRGQEVDDRVGLAEVSLASVVADAGLARDWAVKLSGPVSGTDYSSKYYSQQAAASATAAANSATTSGTSAANASQSAIDAAGYAASINPANLLAKANNLSDVANAATSRTNLGLGSAAVLASTAVLQSANNLSDLVSAATARTNLGLGTAATMASTAFLQPGNNLSDVGTVATARTNLGLGSGSAVTHASLTITTTADVLAYRESAAGTGSLSAGVVTVDCATGNTHTVSVTAAITGWTLNNIPASGKCFDLRIILVGDATARAVAWPAAFNWGDNIAVTTTTVNKETHVLAFTRDGGTTWKVAPGGVY